MKVSKMQNLIIYFSLLSMYIFFYFMIMELSYERMYKLANSTSRIHIIYFLRTETQYFEKKGVTYM